jgi:hypothetical protein
MKPRRRRTVAIGIATFLGYGLVLTGSKRDRPSSIGSRPWSPRCIRRFPPMPLASVYGVDARLGAAACNRVWGGTNGGKVIGVRSSQARRSSEDVGQ